jgi:hypothetical protein
VPAFISIALPLPILRFWLLVLACRLLPAVSEWLMVIGWSPLILKPIDLIALATVAGPILLAMWTPRSSKE